MPLTEKEKRELEVFDNPDVKFMSSAVGGIFSSLFGQDSLGFRKKKVVELRTRLRMDEDGLDKNKDWERYDEICKEEEARFEERFKK